MQTTSLTRRQLLGTAASAAALGIAAQSHVLAADDKPHPAGRLKQSVCHWCFKPMTVSELAAGAAKLGIKSVELVPPSDWPTLKEHGLTCAIAGSHGFAKGFAHKEEWPECLEKLRDSLSAAAAAGVPSVITFSGFRRGLTTDDAMRNMVAGLKQIVGEAEAKKVTLCLEMLNSRVDVEMKGHPDYFLDNIDWGADICRQIGSPRLKLLFDIYHVQIMQGDVIARIKQHHEVIGHYHTAGVPGRNEIGDDQEINYPAIMRAIADTDYTGYIGQEFIPTGDDKLAALADAVRRCAV